MVSELVLHFSMAVHLTSQCFGTLYWILAAHFFWPMGFSKIKARVDSAVKGTVAVHYHHLETSEPPKPDESKAVESLMMGIA